MRSTGFTRKTHDLIHARSCGVCEMCGSAASEQHHHRLPRRMGGSRVPYINSPANGLALCSICHSIVEGMSVTNQWGNRVHGSREVSYRNGWLVRDGDDPRCVAVFTAIGWQTFDDLGHSNPLPQEA